MRSPSARRSRPSRSASDKVVLVVAGDRDDEVGGPRDPRTLEDEDLRRVAEDGDVVRTLPRGARSDRGAARSASARPPYRSSDRGGSSPPCRRRRRRCTSPRRVAGRPGGACPSTVSVSTEIASAWDRRSSCLAWRRSPRARIEQAHDDALHTEPALRHLADDDVGVVAVGRTTTASASWMPRPEHGAVHRRDRGRSSPCQPGRAAASASSRSSITVTSHPVAGEPLRRWNRRGRTRSRALSPTQPRRRRSAQASLRPRTRLQERRPPAPRSVRSGARGPPSARRK